MAERGRVEFGRENLAHPHALLLQLWVFEDDTVKDQAGNKSQNEVCGPVHIGHDDTACQEMHFGAHKCFAKNFFLGCRCKHTCHPHHPRLLREVAVFVCFPLFMLFSQVK